MQNQAPDIPNQSVELDAIIEASPVPFTMDTIGWKILFIILALLIVVMLYGYYKYYMKHAYRRAAVLKIKALAQANPNSDATLISETMFQLKQTALHTYGRVEVASLKGLQWLNFLDEKAKTTHFSRDESLIEQALYNNELKDDNKFDRTEFVASSIKWIKKHA